MVYNITKPSLSVFLAMVVSVLLVYVFDAFSVTR